MSMARRSSQIEQVVRLLMVPLIALWPVVCCCWFEQVGGLANDAPPIATNAEHHEGSCHGPQMPAVPRSNESGGCHDGAGGPCHEDGSGGCACPKSQTTLADAGATLGHVAPALLLAWMPASTLPEIPSGTPECWSQRVERPPPLSLLRLRVLRI
jgi:hypothetical protein